ncbi:MAG: hypothetical protein J2P24_00210 [Streptosporangiales bacterium]|nr:hypothetical protein [Streptosporangiales bacterium]
MRDRGAGEWRPGDPLPEGWPCPAACPDGHPWGPGYVSVSYEGGVGGGYNTYCWPVPPSVSHGRPCRWVWHEPGKGGGGVPRWVDRLG